MKLYFAADPSNSQSQVVYRCREHLEHLGVTWVNDPHDADLLLVQQIQDEAEVMIGMGKPTAILERIDGCQLTGDVRRWIMLPRVRKVIKNSIYHRFEIYNTIRWRYHEDLIREFLGRPVKAPPSDIIPLEILRRKLRLGFSYAAYDRLRPFVEETFDANADRPYDVFFAGTVDYKDDIVTWHRTAAIEAVKNLPKSMAVVAASGRPIPPETYRQVMRQSKIVVSPYGWGELCYRDYEAMLSGCILVKPPMGHVKDPLLVRNVGETCAPDFSDLEEVCQHALSLWDGCPVCHVRHEPQISRQFALGGAGIKSVSSHLYSILESCLEDGVDNARLPNPAIRSEI